VHILFDNDQKPVRLNISRATARRPSAPVGKKMSGSLLLASVAAGDHATGVRRTPTSDLFLSTDIGARPYFGGQGAARWSACGKYISQTEDGEANGDET